MKADASRRLCEADSKADDALGISALYECNSYSQSVFTAGVACWDHTTSSRLLAALTARFLFISSAFFFYFNTFHSKKKEAEILFH